MNTMKILTITTTINKSSRHYGINVKRASLRGTFLGKGVSLFSEGR
jgi:hypothetical protein